MWRHVEKCMDLQQAGMLISSLTGLPTLGLWVDATKERSSLLSAAQVRGTSYADRRSGRPV